MSEEDVRDTSDRDIPENPMPRSIGRNISCEYSSPYKDMRKFKGTRREVGCDLEEWVDRLNGDIENIHDMFEFMYDEHQVLANELDDVRKRGLQKKEVRDYQYTLNRIRDEYNKKFEIMEAKLTSYYKHEIEVQLNKVRSRCEEKCKLLENEWKIRLQVLESKISEMDRKIFVSNLRNSKSNNVICEEERKNENTQIQFTRPAPQLEIFSGKDSTRREIKRWLEQVDYYASQLSFNETEKILFACQSLRDPALTRIKAAKPETMKELGNILMNTYGKRLDEFDKRRELWSARQGENERKLAKPGVLISARPNEEPLNSKGKEMEVVGLVRSLCSENQNNGELHRRGETLNLMNEDEITIEANGRIAEATLAVVENKKTCSDNKILTKRELRDFRKALGIQVNENINEEALCKVEELIHRYRDCFELHEEDLGTAKGWEHEIKRTNETPIKLPYRRIAPALIPEAKELLEDLTRRGVIEESKSPYAAPIILVKKKGGGLRLTIDYRKLNKITIKDAFPLPRISESLDVLEGGIEFGKDITLEIDASFEGLGAVLSQKRGKKLHPVAYATRSLRKY
ncbi:uncharacterized protein [Palaemon carinicauda]|uniref:uncharacterized protein n=1 Tax=Palaemon carinicauda TaxID=392227 RepID=UPI0035B5B832